MSTEWSNDNPFMPKMGTAEQARAYIKSGGIACVETKIEKKFRYRLTNLKIKIQRLPDYKGTDDIILRTLIDSILVDCRAVFLEKPRYKQNATLQNVYRARRQNDKAAEVDEFFDKEILPGYPLRKIIKDWVDKRVAHMDWLWDEAESELLFRIEAVLFSNEMDNLFKVLEKIIEDYEAMVELCGENFREQIEKSIENITGEPEDTTK